MVRFILALLMFALAARADDHADDPSFATLIPPASTGVAGNLERDLDVDWFRFTAAPTIVYTVTVTALTLWDQDIGYRAFAAGDTLYQTNSAFMPGGVSRVVWTNEGGERPYFIGVEGLFQFTTGTYAVAVSTNDADGDDDGMADAWENAVFGTTARDGTGDDDGDGVADIDEYRSGTQATNAASRLVIISLSGDHEVEWPAVTYGSYRVEATSNLLNESSWQLRGTYEQGPAPGPAAFIDPQTNLPARMWRVRYE